MPNRVPFTEYEAVLLLDAFLQFESGKALRKDAIGNCSAKLRRLAIANGMEIDDTYRNTNGISFQMASMESAYRGKTITKPATRLFDETVSMYRNNRKKYEGLLKEAMLMADGRYNGEEAFISWLSKRVSPAQLSELYMTFREIEQQAKKAKIVKMSLYEDVDVVSFKKIRSNIEQSKVFKFTHKWQMGRINTALNYLIQYAQDGVLSEEVRVSTEKENKQHEENVEDTVSAIKQAEESMGVQATNLQAVSNMTFTKSIELSYIRNEIKEGFYQWMLNDCHMAETSCRDYISAIRSAERYAVEHSLESVKLLEVPSEEARKTADVLFEDTEFIEKNKVQHNRFRAAITKLLAYLGEDWTVPDNVKRINFASKADAAQMDLSSYETVLIQNFTHGYRLGSSIEIKKFRRYFEDINGYALEQETDNIEKMIRLCGIEHEGRIYAPQTMLSEELHDQLFDFIDKNFEDGKKVIYYEALFREFSEDFLDQNIYDAEMLKNYIEYMTGHKYFMARSYLSNEKRALIDPIEDVRTCLKEHGLPMEVDDLCKMLSHIPSDRIRTLLGTHGEFVRNSKGEYFHVDSFSVTDEELDNISILINEEIELHSFVSGNELYDIIKRKYPYIYEKNAMFSVIGWRDVLKFKLGDRFSFMGNIISNKDKELSMSDVFAAYGEEQESFTLSELLAFAENMGSIIYFDALYQNAARVSQEQFVSRDAVSFRVIETDKTLGRFCTGSYLALPKVTDFGIFPEASHPWTPYLLEHYVAFHSKRYYLMHGGYNKNTVVGAMVKKENAYDSFDDLIVDVLAESGVMLQKKDVLNYLSDNGYIARRTYTNIEALMIKAQAKRNKKEK